MTANGSSRIQQQMYTRERSGIFRPNEGFDTIAKSAGLDAGFIKKVLHPFCVYDAPTELVSQGEKGEARYPQALHLFHADTGQLVLGRSIYQAADFTGLRSAFFTHNYIIPAERAAAVKDYPGLLRTAFASSYDIEQGMELPELEQLPAEAEVHHPASPSALLASLGIDEKMFKQLLFAVMSSIVTRRKVFVALDVELEALTECAIQLASVLYGSLPYAYRRALGLLTYSKDPQSRKGIHLTFVERGSLRANDRQIDKDYTFDLASRRVTNVDIDLAKQPYLNFAWNNLSLPERAEAFYDFAEQLLQGMDSQQYTAIVSCHELAVLYQIEGGDASLYMQNRNIVLRSMLGYLEPVGAALAKPRLQKLFRDCFDHEYERVQQGQVPDPDIVKCFIEYEAIAGGTAGLGSDLLGYLIRSLYEASKEKNREWLEAYYDLIEGSGRVSQAFFAALLRGGKTISLFFPFMQRKFQKATRAEEVVKLAFHWSSQYPILLDTKEFIDLATGQLMEKLRREVEPVSAVNTVLDMIDRLFEEKSHSASEPMLSFLKLLSYEANVFLLTELELEQVHKEAFLQIDFLAYPDEVRQWATRFPPHVESNAAVMLSAYRWFHDEDPDESLFDGLSPAEMDRLQKLGRRWLQDDLGQADFGRLVLAFYRGIDSGMIEYGSLLHYLQQHASDKETVYKFINWSKNKRFFLKGKKLAPGYASALVAYFKKYDRDAFKHRMNRKLYFDKAGPPLQAVYDTARRELFPPLVRWLHRNRKPLVWLMAIILVGGGITGGMAAFGIFDRDEPVVTGMPGTKPAPPQQAVEKQEPQVYARLTEDVADGELKPQTELVFEFGTEAECAAFQTDTITLKLMDGKEQSYTDFKVQYLCSEGSGASDDESRSDAGAADRAQDTGAGTEEPPSVKGQAGDAEPQTELDGNGDQTPAGDSSENPSGNSVGTDKTAADDTTQGEAPSPSGGTDADNAQDTIEPTRKQIYYAIVSLSEEVAVDHISEVLVNEKMVKYIKK
ncbi:MAG: glycosyltransferase [Bacillota bacterium]